MQARYLTRAELGLSPPRGPIGRLRLPVRRLFVHHSVTTARGNHAADARHLQAIAFGRGFLDVSYGEGIGLEYPGQGTAVLELRGIDRVGGHTAGHNATAIAIVFVGNYHPPAGGRHRPTAAQVGAFRHRVWQLVERGILTRDAYVIDPHRLVSSTACPGDTVAAALPMLRDPWRPLPVSTVIPGYARPAYDRLGAILDHGPRPDRPITEAVGLTLLDRAQRAGLLGPLGVAPAKATGVPGFSVGAYERLGGHLTGAPDPERVLTEAIFLTLVDRIFPR